MKVDKLHVSKLPVSLVAAVLLAAGCASQPTQPEKAATAASATAPTAGAVSSPAAKTSTQAATSSSDSSGQFKKVVRDGQTFYCDRNPRTGSRMSKPYCLNEDQYAAWKEQNDAMKEDIRRNSNPINTSNRDPGPR